MTDDEFRELLREEGRQLFRSMPWRDDTRPYYVLVSEIMLQQTQVERVLPAFERFIDRFPDEARLAQSPFADVMTCWQGLGYNRRAKFLHEAAKMIMTDHHGVFPYEETDLLSLPGVGMNTAGALLAYVYNQPAIFIETNVRTVYLHHFFADEDQVADAVIREKLAATLDREHPREFYWALMDYGSFLKRQGLTHIRRSKHYKKQSVLEGSVRQMRGRIIRVLAGKGMTLQELKVVVDADERFDRALAGLVRDELVVVHGESVDLTK